MCIYFDNHSKIKRIFNSNSVYIYFQNNLVCRVHPRVLITQTSPHTQSFNVQPARNKTIQQKNQINKNSSIMKITAYKVTNASYFFLLFFSLKNEMYVEHFFFLVSCYSQISFTSHISMTWDADPPPPPLIMFLMNFFFPLDQISNL